MQVKSNCALCCEASPSPISSNACSADAKLGCQNCHESNSSSGSTDRGVNRIEHSTMARADQILRMKKLNVQPTF